MTRQERLKQIADASIITHQEMIDRQVFRSCLNCESWDAKTETCLLFKMKPPARVIVFHVANNGLVKSPFNL